MNARKRPLWQLGLITGLGLALMLGFLALGIWQIQRLHWKLDLIARVEARVNAPPIMLAETKGMAPADLEYRPVQVSGSFDHRAETLVQAVTELGGGFWVLTPLRTDHGDTILINRGFVPAGQRNLQSRQEGQVSGPVSVTGLARLTEPGGAFLRSNDPTANRWYSRDVDAISQARGLEQVTSFFIDADATPQPGGYPVGGLTVIRFRNTHLVYALTWFTLSAMVAGGLVMLIRHDRAERRGRTA